MTTLHAERVHPSRPTRSAAAAPAGSHRAGTAGRTRIGRILRAPGDGAQVVRRNGDPPGANVREPVATHREATLSVSWAEDDRDFYHRVVAAVARSPRFSGIGRSALWQPFYDPAYALHRQLRQRLPDLQEGTSVELRASAFFDSQAFHGPVTGATLVPEQTARLRETTVTAVVTPRTRTPELGAGEMNPGDVADLSFTAAPAIAATALGGLRWSAETPGRPAGSSGTVTGSDAGTGSFTAGSPGAVRLELHVASGIHAGQLVASRTMTVTIAGMLRPDPDRPGRLIVDRAGVTPEMIAEHVYGDRSHATAVWAVWDDAAHGPFLVTSHLPAGTWVRIEYRYLKPALRDVIDQAVDVEPRSAWGARPPITTDPNREYQPYTASLEDVLDSIVVHHAGNEGYRTMSEVQNLHMGQQERADVGYHYGVSLQGRVYEGRPIDVVGAHVNRQNTGKIGIVLLADLDPDNAGLRFYQFDRSEDDLSPEMEASLLRLIHSLRSRYPRIAHLGGHKEYDAQRHCPGRKAMDKMGAWRSDTSLRAPP